MSKVTTKQLILTEAQLDKRIVYGPWDEGSLRFVVASHRNALDRIAALEAEVLALKAGAPLSLRLAFLSGCRYRDAKSDITTYMEWTRESLRRYPDPSGEGPNG
jgi:hypothetical protein